VPQSRAPRLPRAEPRALRPRPRLAGRRRRRRQRRRAPLQPLQARPGQRQAGPLRRRQQELCRGSASGRPRAAQVHGRRRLLSCRG